jgi:general secretion pathway protein D
MMFVLRSKKIAKKCSLFCLLYFSIFFVFHSLYLSSVNAADLPEKPVESKEEKITINFNNVDISTFVRFISEKTRKNFLYDERLKGKVTIIAPTKLTTEDAFDLFISVLELKGYNVVFTGSIYKIIPSGTIKQNSMEVSTGIERNVRVNETYTVRLIPLNFILARDTLPLLKPLVSRNAYISAFGKGNSLLVLDTILNIEKILNIIRFLDVEPPSYPPQIVYLKYAQAETLVQILKQHEVDRRSAAPKGAPSLAAKTGPAPIPDKRLNALILFGPPEVKEDYKRLIALLDIPPVEGTSRINVYYLENAEASEISKVLEGLTKRAPSKPGAPPTPISSEFTGSIAITPDSTTNSLIIMASPEDYQTLSRVIKKLDRRPKQVFVEAMIIEVSINKTLELGSKWRASAKKDGRPIVIGGVGTIDTSAIQNIISGLAGFTIGGVANFITIPITLADGSTANLTAPGFAALFSLAEFRDVVNVLSTPHILTSNNKEAEIIVGENVPFLSKIERGATTTNQPILQSIERKDVGITLRIKPQISEGDYIKLDLYQEISSVSSTTQSGGIQAADIITSKRSAKTSVVVKDKQTIVIGGLIQERNVQNLNKIPLLGDIPILGWLFRFSSKQKQKTNLIIYITPTIIKDFNELDELKKEREDKFKGIQPGGLEEEQEKKEEQEDEFNKVSIKPN